MKVSLRKTGLKGFLGYVNLLWPGLIFATGPWAGDVFETLQYFWFLRFLPSQTFKLTWCSHSSRLVMGLTAGICTDRRCLRTSDTC